MLREKTPSAKSASEIRGRMHCRRQIARRGKVLSYRRMEEKHAVITKCRCVPADLRSTSYKRRDGVAVIRKIVGANILCIRRTRNFVSTTGFISRSRYSCIYTESLYFFCFSARMQIFYKVLIINVAIRFFY